MRLRDFSLAQPPRAASLFLDHGADAQECSEFPLEISERGWQLKSRWCFEIGTQLSLSVVCANASCAQSHFAAEGMVVWCERVAGTSPPVYQSTILFLELPEGVRELSSLLAARD